MFSKEPYRWQGKAILAVQEATEIFMIRLFEDAYVTPVYLFFLFRCSTPNLP
jgi:hypothetical protein